MVVLAPAIGVVLERLIFRHLRTASAVPKLVAAIGLAVALPTLFELLANFQAVAGQTPVGVVPNGAGVFYDPFGVYPFSRDELVAMGVAVVAMLALAALFRLTPIGLQMRAVVESPRMTELNGIAADRVLDVRLGAVVALRRAWPGCSSPPGSTPSPPRTSSTSWWWPSPPPPSAA